MKTAAVVCFLVVLLNTQCINGQSETYSLSHLRSHINVSIYYITIYCQEMIQLVMGMCHSGA